MSTNVVKKQHFVPRFYLSRFLNENNEVEVLGCEQRRLMSPRGPKGICCDDFFYGLETGKADEISQRIEQALKTMEDAVSKEIPEFISKIVTGKQIMNNEKWNIAALMSMLWVRGPIMRAQVNSMSENMMKQTLSHIFSGPMGEDIMDQANRESGTEISTEVRDAYKTMMQDGKFSVNFNNEIHLRMFENISGYANLFNAQHWIVYVSKMSRKFITSDNPVATYIPERDGWYGPTFLERTHYFSLSPDICIEARYATDECGKKLVRKTLFEKDRDRVLMLNMKIAGRAHQYVYAKNKNNLEEILEIVRLTEDATCN